EPRAVGRVRGRLFANGLPLPLGQSAASDLEVRAHGPYRATRARRRPRARRAPPPRGSPHRPLQPLTRIIASGPRTAPGPGRVPEAAPSARNAYGPGPRGARPASP